MRPALDDLLDDSDDVSADLAEQLVEQDYAMLRRLVQLRKNHGLRQKDVAERLGISPAAVAAFERPGNDPRLSTVRRYAHAAGVRITHAVTSAHVETSLDRPIEWVSAETLHGVVWNKPVSSEPELALGAIAGHFGVSRCLTRR